MPKAAARALVYLLPLAFCFWLHQYALRGWFWQDDFAWLSLHLYVHDKFSFLKTMFEPLAQGTIRPWSERGFFLLFFKLYGLDALPYHALVMCTQFANLLLVSYIVLKVGGSRLAATLAPAFWVANCALVVPLSWASDYNQVLCAFFLLAAFALYLSGYYWLQLAVFVLGFGALEINIVYPAILLVWLLLNRKDWKPAAPLFLISIAYYLIHRHFAPPASGGPYALYFDPSIAKTFGQYWKQSWVPINWYQDPRHYPLEASLAIALFSLAILAICIRLGRSALFFLAWFLITLAPILPLRDHISQYYLAMPVLGLAIILALGFDNIIASRLKYRFWALFPVILYLWFQIPTSKIQSHWYYERSRENRALVLGVLRAHEMHPHSTILLAHVPPLLYAFSVAHDPFHAAGLDQVYLAPETSFTTYPGLVSPEHFSLPAGPVRQGLWQAKIEVYEPHGGTIRNITGSYRAWAAQNLTLSAPSRVDVGAPFVQYLLGSTWYPLEGSYRWMPAAATIRIAAPRTPDQKLVITGYCPQEQISSGPLQLHISIDGKEIAGEEFSKPETPFVRTFNLPASALGKVEMEVGLSVNRTFQGEEQGRRLGLAFGTVEVR
jgi:hypothetical protein